ncbi:Fibrinogen-like protein 1 [Lamellibrachia satsuma]|nr:Fibrinogen-like protein 1 [Lamellibrachia satsuma]
MDATLSHAAFLAFCVGLCSERNGFVKDQSTDRIPFPPGVPPRKPYSDIPIGHLRPLVALAYAHQSSYQSPQRMLTSRLTSRLSVCSPVVLPVAAAYAHQKIDSGSGYQRPPDGTVAEAKKMAMPRDFYLMYIKHFKPIVFRQSLDDVPAMTTWAKDSYLKTTYGDLDIDVVVKKERAKSVPMKMTFNQFLRDYQYEDWYLSTVTPREMLLELAEEAEIWMSSGGTASLLHSHADHNLHCVLAGRKDFILIQPKYKDKLAFHSENAYPEAGSSEIDMDRINMFKYKSVSDVPWSWSTLWSGDCIYIPAGHLLQVRSHGRSISFTIHWFPTPKVSFRKCDTKKLASFLPLSESKFMWTYIGGTKQLSVPNMTPRRMKRHLLLLMRTDQFLSFDRFQSFYDEVMREVCTSNVHDGEDKDEDIAVTEHSKLSDGMMAPSCRLSACVVFMLVLNGHPAGADVFDQFNAIKAKTKELHALLDTMVTQQKTIQGLLVGRGSVACNFDADPPRSCLEYLAAGYSEDTLYTVWTGETPNRRSDFNRTWTEYEEGFGNGLHNERSEFWLGLRTLHRLTAGPVTWQLRVDIVPSSSAGGYRIYEMLRIAGPEDKYRLTVANISKGTIVNALAPTDNDFNANGSQFSTWDSDNDAHSSSCISKDNKRGGWWYNSCSVSDPTSVYLEQGVSAESDLNVIKWLTYRDIKKVTFSIRPVY